MLYGRDAERQAIGALLDAARDSRSGALVLRGEPGMGKTALLQDARDRAGDMHVLMVKGVESESELAFAGLHQFARPALHLVDALPGPQARALQAALGLVEHAEDDRFLVSAACLTLLSELAERRPVLCLIDDAQWVDTPSADALLFVARRLGAEGIAMLFAARDGSDRLFEARGLDNLELRGLDCDAAALVIARGVDGEVAQSVRDALVRHADGNALALIELPAALTRAQLDGSEPLPDTLPLTRVEHAFLERVHRLSEPAQRLLLVIAADETGQLATTLAAAAALDADESALEEAERSGLAVVHGSRVDVHHPLVRSAVYQAASSGERRAVHLALAAAFEHDPDRRTWHLAAGALGPDEEVAAALERAGIAALERAGFAAAAAAFERAAGLSPDEGPRLRRLYRAAEASWQGGNSEHGVALARQALANCREPRLRAELMHLIGHVEHFGAPLMPAHDLLWEAAELIGEVDPAKAAAILTDAFEACLFAGEAKGAVAAARRAREFAPRDGGKADYLGELNLAEALFINGRAADGAPLFEHALEIFSDAPDLRSDARLATHAAIALCWLERCAEARRIILPALAGARERGEIAVLPYALFIVAWAARRVGAWQESVAAATEGVSLARELGHVATMAQCLQELSTLAALQGRESDCREHVATATAAAESVGAHYITEICRAQLGLLELGAGENERAVVELAGCGERLTRLELRLHELLPGPDLVEALVRLGRLDDARTALALVWQGSNPRTAPALAARCHGLVADDQEFDQQFVESLALHPEDEDVFGRARTQLAFGERLRRARRRVEAREHLRAALEVFERLGAAPWAARTRAELRASGETARKRDPSTVTQLTPQELQVARFVAQGLSNKEVAAQLFLSPRTIDAHLRNVFSKLELTSRTQLARLPLGDEDASELEATSTA